jgi:hypothetical protein
LLGLLLAALDLWRDVACGVNRRRTEIGIRLALGTTPGTVVRRVLARVSILVEPASSPGSCEPLAVEVRSVTTL